MVTHKTNKTPEDWLFEKNSLKNFFKNIFFEKISFNQNLNFKNLKFQQKSKNYFRGLGIFPKNKNDQSLSFNKNEGDFPFLSSNVSTHMLRLPVVKTIKFKFL